jgi:putative transposase
VTLALHYVRLEESLVSVLEALKSRLDELGVRVGLWLADRAFCCVATLRWFSQQPEAIVPMVARGCKSPLSASRILFASKQSYWDKYTMHSETDGDLTFDVAVVRRNSRPSRSRGKRLPPTTLVYAVVGKRLRRQLRRRSFHSLVETYRRRFSIESSYRQLNQARFRTSSRSPELRLLAVAIALLLRNLWALCQWMTLARSAPGRPTGESSFRFRTLLRWISRMIETRLALQTTIELPTPSTTSFLLQLVPVADY